MTARTSGNNTAVVGLQWGDEGKGKVVDLLAAEHDVIVRYNGGANAGHTVVIGEERYAMHLLPSGILSPGTICVIGNGVVVDPETLLEEINMIEGRGIDTTGRLMLSNRSHVVMPYHKEHDAALESYLSGSVKTGDDDLSIGTTKRGIGPAYADKVHRSTAIRAGDLLDRAYLEEKLRLTCALRSAELTALGIDTPPLDPFALAEHYHQIGQQLAERITDTTYLLNDYRKQGKRLLFEGANACLLDIDHGTYPYVTSSNCSTLGIPAGTGLAGHLLDRTVGIMKAYTTRVGAGPFPTELENELGERIRERGREYGTTTGRPRRCGWLDLVAVRYSAMVCGATELAVMLLDVLSGFDELKICSAYQLPDGRTTDRFIPDARGLIGATPMYETVPGWQEEIDHTTERSALPAGAQAYLDRIEALTELPIGLVSVGPERTQTMIGA